MQKQRFIKGVLSGALVGALMLGTVGLVSATTDSSSSDQSSNTKSSIECKMPRGPGHGMGMELDLTSLVTNGIITNAESTSIQTKIDELNADRKAEMEKVQAMTETEREAYFKAKQTTATEKTDFLTTLVNENIISSGTADAIRTATQAQKQKEQQARLTEGLSSLVDKGTITSAQSKLILAELRAQQTDRQAEMEKVKAMTETEREAYFKANTTEKANFLADLVTAGTITQVQADAVRTVVGGPNRAGKGGSTPDRNGQAGHGKGMGHGGGIGTGPANSSTTQTNTND